MPFTTNCRKVTDMSSIDNRMLIYASRVNYCKNPKGNLPFAITPDLILGIKDGNVRTFQFDSPDELMVKYLKVCRPISEMESVLMS